MNTKLLSLSALSLVGALASSGALAQTDIRLGEPAYGGTGCPAGTASVTLTPDSKSLSILFDQYVAEANSSRRLDRKACNIAIPVHVPQGYSVSILAVDYRGFNALPKGAQSDFSVEYFFAGATGPKFSQTFRGEIDKDYFIRNNLIASAVVWSPCGQDVILRTNSSIRVTTNARGEEAMSTLDSQDVNAALLYSLSWQRCR